MNQCLELHDSTLESVSRGEAGIRLVIAAYIHKSAGQPGVDPGTGWSGIVHLFLRAGQVTPDSAQAPLEINQGQLKMSDQTFSNCIPLPFTSEKPAHLTLRGFRGEEFSVEGAGILLEPDGEPEYVEDFPGLG